MIAPHVLYRTSSEYDSERQHMTLMGYVPVEVYRAQTGRDFSYDVRYRLLDREQFQQAARELGERERLAAG